MILTKHEAADKLRFFYVTQGFAVILYPRFFSTLHRHSYMCISTPLAADDCLDNY